MADLAVFDPPDEFDLSLEEVDFAVVDFVELPEFERLEDFFAPPEVARFATAPPFGDSDFAAPDVALAADFFEPALVDLVAVLEAPVAEEELDLDDLLFVDPPVAFDDPRPFPADVAPDLESASFLLLADSFALDVALLDDAVFFDVVGICYVSRPDMVGD